MRQNKNSNCRTSLSVLLYVFMAFVAVGCNEMVQTGEYSNETYLRELLPQANKIIYDGLLDEDPRIRTNAIEAVATAGRLQFMPVVERLLTDQIVPVRFAAALAVGDTKYRDAKGTLNVLYRSPDENTRLAAAYALYKLGDKNKLSAFGQAISSKDMSVRANAVFLLGKCGDKSSLTPLYWAKDAVDSDDKVRFQAAEAIAKLGDERIYPKLWTMILNVNADDRIFGLRAMGELGTESAQGALTTALSDPNEVLEVRLVAAEQLAKLGYTYGEAEVLKVFTKNLTADMDEQDAERVNVLTALAIGQIRTANLTKYLPKLLNDRSKFVRLAAAKAVFQSQISRPED